MKAEVCTNVLRAESVSNTYWHKLALKYWKPAAMRVSDLPSPVYKPRKETPRCGHLVLPTGLCHCVPGEVSVWPLERRFPLFVCTLICAWARDNSNITFLSSGRVEIWCSDPNIWSASLGDLGEEGWEDVSKPEALNPFIRSHPLFLVEPRALLLVNWEISDKSFWPDIFQQPAKLYGHQGKLYESRLSSRGQWHSQIQHAQAETCLKNHTLTDECRLIPWTNPSGDDIKGAVIWGLSVSPWIPHPKDVWLLFGRWLGSKSANASLPTTVKAGYKLGDVAALPHYTPFLLV